ncbi:MAG: ATP-dependent Clp protease adaptor ClpS [Candidatus Thiodiazotropha sp. 6PDIVS]
MNESAVKVISTWDKVKNEFPEDIKQLISKENSDIGSKLVLLNDDDTPMEYVVFVLENLFGLENEIAVQKMLEVHEKGSSTIVHSVSSESAEKTSFIFTRSRKF